MKIVIKKEIIEAFLSQDFYAFEIQGLEVRAIYTRKDGSRYPTTLHIENGEFYIFEKDIDISESFYIE